MSRTDFNDLYDVTDDEVDEIKIQFSPPMDPDPNLTPETPRRFPSLIIPSPSHWPTIHNHQKPNDATLLSPNLISPMIASPSPRALNHLASQRFYGSRAPSLDNESFTSEEQSNPMSCPATPDLDPGKQEISQDWLEGLQQQTPELTPDEQQSRGGWFSPVQLHPDALQTLACLTAAQSNNSSPVHISSEMQEVSRFRPSVRISTDQVNITPSEPATDTELSALTVPSPGGFFSSLEPSSRTTWFPGQSDGPSTSTAEQFYGVPWIKASVQYAPPVPAIPERYITKRPDDDEVSDGPPTAIKIPQPAPNQAENSVQDPLPPPISTASDYDESYEQKRLQSANEHLDRTAMWLISQDVSIVPTAEDPPMSPPPTTPLPPIPGSAFRRARRAPRSPSAETVISIPPKSVRFAEAKQTSPTTSIPTIPPDSPKEDTFLRGFEYLQYKKSARDVFVHRKTRSNKLRLDRRCLFENHVQHLDATYELKVPERKGTMRPTSEWGGGTWSNLPEERVEAIFTAQKERSALEQIKPVAWSLEAAKMLNGGTLLTSPTGRTFARKPDAKLLDLGGHASCDWAWQVAMEHPSADIYTVYTDEREHEASNGIAGPDNHTAMHISSLWDLPYEDCYFDVVSARNLFAHLKTHKTSAAADAGMMYPQSPAIDEYDMCLRECLRVLKPGGYLEFAMLDADIVGGGQRCAALGVEFSFSLRTRGYDAAPTKSWLPRVRRAGFGQVRRAWLALPMAGGPVGRDAYESGYESGGTEIGTTADASHVTSLVGSWAWERWMLKLHREMGRDGDRLLEGVPAALEEGARTGASWRYLSGWARKPV
ncbi:hypothetical protein EJ06DRAFT_477343 [Trichodelitschia bisporula]|uniref:Methyltransferase type 11 domain-containing protein n=1 Tax=Trichodelitschia bisporula TaxID=703511 RepID=A0A6G1HWL7_9PEZI|nr:hypothetical protein EJ06DRAFT_477343 [Trichodelitschia bisporula]